MLKKTVAVLRYIARICVALIHVIVGKKKDRTCEYADDTTQEDKAE